MGFSSQQQRFNTVQIRRGFEALLIIILYCVFLFRDANTIQEYIYTIFMIISTIGILMSFVSTANKTATIFVMIGKIEKIVNDGKYRLRKLVIDSVLILA